MVLNIDLAPTILSLAGVPVPAGMQGTNLTSLLANPATKGREDWYYEHLYSDPTRRPIPKSEGVRTDRWKYTRYTEPNPALEQLFDLTTDPGEEKDLAGDPAHRDVLAQLRTRCDEYRVSLK
jgi:arylsulfatase A-like enzyme